MTLTKTYYLTTAFQSEWLAAFDFCKSCGMDLVTLKDQAEVDNFLAMCKQSSSSFQGGTFGYKQAYIGGLLTNPDWRWFQTGDPISFDLTWAKNEPSQYSESCLAIMPGSGGFSDAECFGVSYSFICEEVKGKSAGLTTKPPGKFTTVKKNI